MYKTTLSRLFLIFAVLLLFPFSVAAQNITPEMIEKAKAMGVSQAQIDAAIKQQGANASASGSKTIVKSAYETKDVDRNSKADSIYRENFFSKRDSLQKKSKTKIIFGQEIFSKRNLSFAPNFNIATPKNYQLGAGDDITINIWGASEDNINQKISPDGRVVIPTVGPVYLGGMTIEAAEAKLRKTLSKIYSGLNGGSTHLSLSLRNIRSIKVNIVGEVATPGTYTLPSLATLFNAIYVAGGVNEIGSLRSIKVYRNSKLVGNLDVYDYLLNGKFDSNVRLEDNDMIVVSPYESIVTTKGSLKRPRIFEMKKGETVDDVIRFAGGFKSDAYSQNITIERSNGRQYEVHTVEKDEYKTFKIQDGDTVSVGGVMNTFSNKLEIIGAVHRPGIYALDNKVSTLLQLLQKAEGVRGDAFLTRGQITRTLPDSSKQMIAVDLYALLNGKANDVELQSKDIIFVPSIYELQEKFTVAISGAVDTTGVFPYKKDMTVEDLIIEARGLTYDASMQRIEVSRRVRDPYSLKPTNKIAEVYNFAISENLQIAPEAKRFVLQPFDEVFVRRSPGYERQQNITLTGEVVFGGVYSLTNKEQRLSDVIKSAGLTDFAYVKGARLVRKMTHDDSLRVITLLKLAAHNNSKTDSIDFAKMDIGDEYFIGIDLEKALKEPRSEADVVLKDGDVVNIPQYNSTVKISGAVLYPNTVTYSKSRSLNDYVSMAGGFGDRAKKSKSFVIYMNGTVAKGRSSKIEPGCEIVVPTKPDKKGSSAAEILGIASSTASIAAMLATFYNVFK